MAQVTRITVLPWQIGLTGCHYAPGNLHVYCAQGPESLGYKMIWFCIGTEKPHDRQLTCGQASCRAEQ
jgi:hypothetical protein